MRKTVSVFLPWVIPVLLLAAWQVLPVFSPLSSATLPPPSQVLKAAWDLSRSGDLPGGILVSLRRIGIGFALGAASGLVLGFLVGMSRTAEGLIDRSLQMVRVIPHLALVPLMIAWFGIGEEPKIILVALGTLFPVYLNTVNGIRNVDGRLIQLGMSYGLGRLALVRDIILMGAMPSILTGIRYALGVAWLTLVIAETINAKDGVGYIAQNAREMLRNDQIIVAILVYALAGLLADQITRTIEHRALRWHAGYQTQRS
ncbi:ABC transporter permease subunit [Xylophilus sp.]|uniref:ABC transporter permease subunit n=1 Tax=Xylophilus sp. TaxID=2653893 RepID=UPI0013BA67E4|nr:ABC transporter permease subunit [Xylophilus sp.]KAF1047908.1 MAG: putative aliphatic sulfonates transport permease protein SsuC [Xylophilus sp.]